MPVQSRRNTWVSGGIRGGVAQFKVNQKNAESVQGSRRVPDAMRVELLAATAVGGPPTFVQQHSGRSSEVHVILSQYKTLESNLAVLQDCRR